MRFVYSSFALWSIFSTINGLPRLEPVTWNILKEVGIAKRITRRGCKSGVRKVRPIATVQGYGRYSGSSCYLQPGHLDFQNDYYTPFMQISSSLSDHDFSNNKVIDPLRTTQANLTTVIPDGRMNCSFTLMNCRSVCNKALTIKDLVVDSDMDILGITETWLRGNDLDNPVVAELVPNGYSFNHLPRLDGRGGGVGLMFKKSLDVKFSTVPSYNSFEVINAEIKLAGKSLNLYVIYRPPPSSVNRLTVDGFMDEFSSLLEASVVDPRPLLITGDFNFHVDDESDLEAMNFCNLLDSFNLCQYVTVSTHGAGHILDLVISRNSDDILKSLSVECVPISDHWPITCSLNLNKPPFERKMVQCRQLKSINFDDLRNDLLMSRLGSSVDHISDLDSMLDPSDVASNLADQYDNVLSSLLDTYAPLKTKTIVLRPRAAWYSNDIAECKKQRRQLERKWRRTRLPCDRANYERMYLECKDLIYSTKRDYFNTIISENSQDQKVLFQTIDHLLCGEIKNTEYPTCSDDKSLAEKFMEFFTSKIEGILSGLQRSTGSDDACDASSQCESTFCNFHPVSDDDISKLVNSTVKSCSLDPLPSSVFLNCSDILVPFLTKFINYCLFNGIMPDALKIAKITPILKKSGENCELLKNFRPVSNLKFISKLMERVVVRQLNCYLNHNGLLEKFQSAYKTAHSTETALLKIQSDILMSLDNGKAVVVVFLDMSAAFDTVNHKILLTRLSDTFGIRCEALEWFKSYLENRKQFVAINDAVSSVRDLRVGVPQGSVLGPILYTLYTSPVSAIIKNYGLDFHFYADDSQLYIAFSHNNHQQLLEAKGRIECCIADIQRWMTVNDLKLNQDKTEIMLIHSKFKADIDPPSYLIGDEVIEVASTATNLGFIFDKYLCCHDQVRKVCKSSFYFIRNIARIRRFLTDSATESVVHAFITSKLDYCNSLYYGLPKYLVKRLQYIQNCAARLVVKSRKFDHITPAFVKLHWLPVRFRIVFKILLIVYKCLNNMAPEYLADAIKLRKTRSLRSTTMEYLEERKSRTVNYGDRSFVVAGPKLWNGLPLHIRKSSSIGTFKTKLKTHLFKTFLIEIQH